MSRPGPASPRPPPSHSVAAAMAPVVGSVTAAPWQCGPRRLALRRKFNANELDAANILQRHDKNGDGLIGAGELKPLLQQFSNGLVTQTDVDYVLTVADASRDGALSEAEVLQGMRAWYSLQNLPKAVDSAVQAFGIVDAPLPSAEELINFLAVVNESQPVTLEEAARVRSTALALGAIEGHVTAAQIRGAVAEWYLQVEREESGIAHLGKKAAEEAFRKVATILKGEFELTPTLFIALFSTLVVVALVVPILEIVVSHQHPFYEDWYCEHEELASVLEATGYLTILAALSAAGAYFAKVRDLWQAKLGFAAVAVLLAIVLAILEISGIVLVHSSSSNRCGPLLWTFSYLVYCFFPSAILLLLCCGFPCLVLIEYNTHKSLDKSLTLAARRRGSSGRSPSRGLRQDIAVVKLPEAELWQCGLQRLTLRRKFNDKEIDAAKVMRKYDKDGSGVLEVDELEQLLRDYNENQDVSEEDLEYIMRVSDFDRDETISKHELLFGLRTWYAYQQMPKTVGLAFTKHKIHDGPMPSAQAIGEFLATVNESQPVSEAEVRYVQRVALALGASEETVTVAQMRRAVAVWYLHIKRPETTALDLAKKSLRDVKQKLFNVKEHAIKAYQGEVDYTSASSLAFIGVILFITIVHPILDMLIASGFPNADTCEHPQLDDRLWWTGLTTLCTTLAAVACVLVGTSDQINSVVKYVSYGLLTAFVVALITLQLVGFVCARSSTIARCGLVLWSFCNFTYVVMPVLSVFTVCCGIPCLFGIEYYDNIDADDSFVASGPSV